MKLLLILLLVATTISCGKKHSEFLINLSEAALPKPANTPDFDYYEWITQHPKMAGILFKSGKKGNEFKISLEDGNNNGKYNELGKDIVHILPIDEKIVEFGDFCNNGIVLSDSTVIKYQNSYFLISDIDKSDSCKWIKLKKTKEIKIANAIFLDTNFPNINCQKIYPKKEYTDIKKIVESNNKNFTLVSFWASWCQPCIAEIPKINNLGNKMTILSFNADEDKKDAIKVITEKKVAGFHFDATPNICRIFCQGMFPTLLLYDKNLSLVLKTFSIDEVTKYISKHGEGANK